MEKMKKVAIFVDGNTTHPSELPSVIKKMSNYGEIVLKKVYANWVDPQFNLWSDITNDGFALIQEKPHLKGRNNVNALFIIDVVDTLIFNEIDVFCIVTSESDFTELISRIKQTDKQVIGIGQKKTPRIVINLCQEFYYSEELAEGLESAENKSIEGKLAYLKSVVESLTESDGFARLDKIGQSFKNSNFEIKNYGFGKYSNMFKYLSAYFEMNTEGLLNFIKIKENNPKKTVNFKEKEVKITEKIEEKTPIESKKEPSKFLKKRYNSKIDTWLVAFLAILLIVVPTPFSLLSILLKSAVILFVIYLFSETYYEIKENKLIVKAGFLLNETIDISTITEVRETSNMLSSPALSLDRLAIIYGGNKIIISPREKAEFITHLLKINDKITIIK